jgi:hypothetical protein
MAFDGCKSLVSFFLPASLEFIDGSAITGGCTVLVLDPNNKFFAYVDHMLTSADGTRAIKYCGSSERVSISNIVRTLDMACLAPLEKLRFVEIPASVTAISDLCFWRCTALKAVIFSAGSVLENVGRSGFFGCIALRSIILPASVSKLYALAFSECTSLEKVTFEAGSILADIERESFHKCRSLTGIIIPAAVEHIGSSAFKGCHALTQLQFESGSRLTALDEAVFRKCISLKSLVIPLGVRALPQDCFAKCAVLDTVSFEPNSRLESIHDQGFVACPALAKIEVDPKCPLAINLAQDDRDVPWRPFVKLSDDV